MTTYTTPEIDVHEAMRLVHDGSLMLDVREDHEWVAGHAPEAVHAPLSSLATAPLPSWSTRRVVVVCRSGNRSKQATDLLRHRGIEAISLAGGMNAWQQSGGQVVTSTGDAGRIV
jgi:rhodanese-related sulfurtransferase